jgi:hypothetical protein
MEMYEPGDHVICRSGGVWRVSEREYDKIHLIEHESRVEKAEKKLPAGSTEIVRKIALKEGNRSNPVCHAQSRQVRLSPPSSGRSSVPPC